MQALRLVDKPEHEPIDLEFARTRLRLPNVAAEDDFIETLISKSRQYVERQTGRVFVTQTWKMVIDSFPTQGWIDLSLSPLQEIQSITYRDVDGNATVMDASSYVADVDHEPGRIAMRGAAWPGGSLQIINAIEIVMVAGYGEPEDVPEIYKEAIGVLVTDGYENRETSPTPEALRAVEALLNRDTAGIS